MLKIILALQFVAVAAGIGAILLSARLRHRLSQIAQMQARLAHAGTMDLAVWAQRMPQVQAVDFVRTHVDGQARDVMRDALGTAYDDWLRSLYASTQASAGKR